MSDKDSFKAIGEFVLSAVCMVGSMVIQGVVFRDLWNWFAATAFHVPSITFGQSVGLGFLYGWLSMGTMLMITYHKSKDAEVPQSYVRSFTGVAVALIYWGAAAIWHFGFAGVA